MPESIILDCDPGHDDAMAIILAAGHPNIDIIGITTCAGNQTIEKVTHNALAVATLVGLTVPIAQGASRGLVRPQIVAPDIHGESGLEGPVLPEPTMSLDPRHAVQFIIDEVMSRPPKTVTLVAVGPLTNIALALRQEPRLAGRVKQIAIMGGGTRGNRTPAAEFNIAADPEAAAMVFETDWPIIQAGLDVTHTVVADQAVLDRFAAIDSDLGRFISAALEFYGDAYRTMQGFPFPPVHDPVAVAAVADPSLVVLKDAFVAVELAGTWTAGMTVTDFHGLFGHAPNTHVIASCNVAAFWDEVFAAVAVIDAAKAS